MYRILLVFIQAYWGNVTRRSYLMLTFGMPLMFVLIPAVVGGVGALVIRSALPPDDPRPIAIVDLTADKNFSDVELFGDDPASLLPFESEAAALAALAAEEVQSYYIIPADYLDGGVIKADYLAQPSMTLRLNFESWMRQQVRALITEEGAFNRYLRGSDITHLDLMGNEAYDEDNRFEWGAVFVAIYFSRVIGIFTAGYMYNSIAEEARNRTMEILLTSVSPVQFVTGKLFGLIAVGLTQVAVWAGIPLLGFGIYAAYQGDNLFEGLADWEPLLLVFSLLLGAYLLDQLFAAAAGILRVSGGAGPQLLGVVNWLTMLALAYAATFVPLNPDTSAAVTTSLFPLTSPIVMLTRVVASDVPTWQIVLSQILLWGSIFLLLLWLGWLMRRNMLANAPRFALFKWMWSRLRFSRTAMTEGGAE